VNKSGVLEIFIKPGLTDLVGQIEIAVPVNEPKIMTRKHKAAA
jgi:hypothetical protein